MTVESIERFRDNRMFDRTGIDSHDLRTLHDTQAIFVEIDDTDTSTTLNTVRHGLGRIPRGIRMVNMALENDRQPAAWYRMKDDPAWTSRELSLRFQMDNAHVLLEVF